MRRTILFLSDIRVVLLELILLVGSSSYLVGDWSCWYLGERKIAAYKRKESESKLDVAGMNKAQVALWQSIIYRTKGQ